MEMRAREDINKGEDLTPPLLPLASALYNSTLSTHCSACFSPLTSSHFTPTNSHNPSHVPSFLYCSPLCSSLDSPLHVSSSECHLLHQSPPSTSPDSSDLRLSLRLLSLFKSVTKNDLYLERIEGIMTNRERLLPKEEDQISDIIRIGAKAMMAMRRIDRDGFVEENEELMCTAMLCLVMTNAVEVQDKNGIGIGIAVYDTTFSWINHSCSPSACYRFSTVLFNGDALPLKICPASVSKCAHQDTNIIGNAGRERYGPRLIIRSIKAIKKGEEVTITYTDLLQPKGMRQSELWLKYRFNCSCKRCNTDPATYVDQTLQEIISTSHQDLENQEAIEGLTHRYDDAINEYLSLDNPKSCCQKLENLLTHGHIIEQKYMLHPLHHLSLNAYTILSSAYKVQSNDLLYLSSETEAFKLMRVSAAFELLLAGATHHLYISEASLIVSVVNFWTNAGESLINLAKSEMWDLHEKGSFSLSNYECYNCLLFDGFVTQTENTFKPCFSCIIDITSRLWTFLAYGNSYLRLIKDPIDFKWLDSVEESYRIFNLDSHCVDTDRENSEFRSKDWEINNKVRFDIFQLGIHCLLYGAFLSRICFGEYSHLIANVRDILKF